MTDTPEPIVVTPTDPEASAPALRKKELLDAVVEQTGAKRKDVKPIVEAMLSVLGNAVAEDRELNLQPFGKLKIQKVKEVANGRITVAKIRQSKAT